MEIIKERVLIDKLSNEQSAILAEEILKVQNQSEVPKKKVTHDEFCSFLAMLKQSISRDFHKYDEERRFTRHFIESGLSVADLGIFKDSLINKAAMLVAKKLTDSLPENR